MVVRARASNHERGGYLSRAEAERLFTRPPTAREVAEAFRGEIQEMVPQRLRLAEEALGAMEALLAPDLEEIPEADRPAVWGLLKVAWGLDEIEHRAQRYRQFLALAKPGRQGYFRHLSAEEVKRRVDILNLCRSLGIDLTRSGRRWRARCPFPDHVDTCPSFFVDPATQRFCCYGCGRRGDAIDLVMALKRVGFREALEELGRAA